MALDEYLKKRMRNEAVANLALVPKNTLENAIAANAIVLFSVETNTLRFRTHCYIHWASSVEALAGEEAARAKET